MANGWKITAIVFILLFVLETAFVGWGLYLVQHEEEVRADCYWNICENYPYAEWNVQTADNVCYCYDEDYELVTTKYMK